MLDHVGQVAARGPDRGYSRYLGLEHDDPESFTQLRAARTAMQRASAQQRRYVVTVAEKCNRAVEVGAHRTLADRGAMTGILRGFPSVDLTDDVERRVDAAAAHDRDRVEQQIQALAGNDLTNVDHTAGDSILGSTRCVQPP